MIPTNTQDHSVMEEILGRKANTDTIRLMKFALGSEHFHLPLHYVCEVSPLTSVTPVPFTPAHFMGVMNIRGQVISVVDTRVLLGTEIENTPETSVIVCECNGLHLGMVVSNIETIQTTKKHLISTQKSDDSEWQNVFVYGTVELKEETLRIFDIPSLFNRFRKPGDEA